VAAEDFGRLLDGEQRWQGLTGGRVNESHRPSIQSAKSDSRIRTSLPIRLARKRPSLISFRIDHGDMRAAVAASDTNKNPGNLGSTKSSIGGVESNFA
jgi:hypothetical protein